MFQDGACDAKKEDSGDASIPDKLKEELEYCPGSSSAKLPLVTDKYTYYRKKKLSRRRLGSSVDTGLADKSKKRRVSGDLPETAEVEPPAVTSGNIGLKKCHTEKFVKRTSMQPVSKLKSSLRGDHSSAKDASRQGTKVSHGVQSMSICMIFSLVVAKAFVLLNSGFVKKDTFIFLCGCHICIIQVNIAYEE